MFAAIVLERDPLQWKHLPSLLENWVQDVGGFATVGVLVWLAVGFTTFGSLVLRLYLAINLLGIHASQDSPAQPQSLRGVARWQKVTFICSVIGALIAYTCWLIAVLIGSRAVSGGGSPFRQAAVVERWSLTIGGLCGLIAAGVPFVLGLFRLRWRRIGAIAGLSFKEAIRRRVLYVFSIFLLVVLFAGWFIPHKPEDQVRTYVEVVFGAMTPLLLLAGAIIAAFSIPTDMRQQTIHTIITKPVERFEIVLGRFLGFTALMSVVLLVMTGLSLIYIVRGVDPDAAEETLKAREPLNGDLHFLNTGNVNRGTNVGRVWEYRSYIQIGPPGREPTAVWTFDAPPQSVADRENVQCEFSFDIFRTTKGKENEGIPCSFTFETANFDPAAYHLFLESYPLQNQGKKPDPLKVAEEFGFYEVPGKQVQNEHTQIIEVPGVLFRNALKAKSHDRAVTVKVRCTTPNQFVGMAKYDLYFRLDDPSGSSDRLNFAWNFLKGAVGLWCRVCMVIGLGVALSTYLSGVISLTATLLLYLGGVCEEFIRTVGLGKNDGGGALQALYRLTTRQNLVAPLEENPIVRVATRVDEGYRFAIRRVLNLIPDVDRFDLTKYVAEGFNIPSTQLALNVLLLLGYLLPWAVLGYYLLKWREVASSS